MSILSLIFHFPPFVGRATEAAGLARTRPYDLRHSFASLLLHEGRSVIYIARQLGHDARLTLSRYGHVIAIRTRRAAFGARIRSVTRAELHKLVDELPDTAVEGAGVLLRGIVAGPVDPDQAWFWTPEWRRKEREAEADKAAGRVDRFRTDEKLLAALGGRSGSSDADV